jgi:hypothetical protein
MPLCFLDAQIKKTGKQQRHIQDIKKSGHGLEEFFISGIISGGIRSYNEAEGMLGTYSHVLRLVNGGEHDVWKAAMTNLCNPRRKMVNWGLLNQQRYGESGMPGWVLWLLQHER